jgi:adenylate cyclase
MVTREIDTIKVPGKNEAKKVFEIMGMRMAISPELIELKEKYEAGIAFYLNRDWGNAQKAFNRCLEIKPDDGPSATFIKRTEHFMASPPEPGWDGTWTITQK